MRKATSSDIRLSVRSVFGRRASGDFTVFEDGVEQRLSFFASEAVPVDVALVIDASSSMGADLPLVRSAACGLVRTLRTRDGRPCVLPQDGG